MAKPLQPQRRPRRLRLQQAAKTLRRGDWRLAAQLAATAIAPARAAGCREECLVACPGRAACAAVMAGAAGQRPKACRGRAAVAMAAEARALGPACAAATVLCAAVKTAVTAAMGLRR